MLAAASLWMLVTFLGHSLPRSRRLWLHCAVMAVVGNALPFFLITWGQQGIQSGLAGILMAVMPLTTLVLAHFTVPGERATGRRAVGFALGFLGIVVLMGPDALRELGGSGSELLSQLAVLSGAVCYAANTIIARKLPATHPLVASTCVMLVASALMVPIAAVLDQPWRLAPPAIGLASLLWLGLASTALATVVYFTLIASAGPTFVSLMNYVIPVVAVAAGVALLGEEPELAHLLALLLILAGIAWSQLQHTAGLRARILGGADRAARRDGGLP